jgi:hypothetical protein
MDVLKVCSHLPSAWAKYPSEVTHLSSNKERTFCGIKCEEWLVIDKLGDDELETSGWRTICQRCYKKGVKL